MHRVTQISSHVHDLVGLFEWDTIGCFGAIFSIALCAPPCVKLSPLLHGLLGAKIRFLKQASEAYPSDPFTAIEVREWFGSRLASLF